MTVGYSFIDIETTGLDADKNFMTEVAAVKTDGYGNVLAEINLLIKLPEGEKVPEFITELTGIDDALLAEHGGDIATVMEMLRTFIKDDVVVAQYAPFDLSFIEKHFTVDDFFDTRTLAYALDLPKANLKGLAEHYGIDMGEHHRALDDAHTCRKIFEAQAGDMELRMMNLGDYLNAVGTKAERMPSVYPINTQFIVDYDEKAGE